MNIIMTPTQKYNDLKSLVKRSYADEKERNEMWEYIAGYILANNGNEIQENNLEAFSRLTEHKGLLAHIDIVVPGQDLAPEVGTDGCAARHEVTDAVLVADALHLGECLIESVLQTG